MEKLEISKHPLFEEITRKIEFGILSIDYKRNIAKWPFELIHFNDNGENIANLFPNVQGLFTISNQRNIDPKTGERVPFPEEQYDENGNAFMPEMGGVPEFDFLNMALLQAGVSPSVLGIQRVLMSDKKGIFNDYTRLMSL